MHVSNYFYNEPNIRARRRAVPAHRLRARLLLQLRHGGERGDAQAGAAPLLRHGREGSRARRRVRQRVPRAHARCAVDDRHAEVPRGLRPARSGDARALRRRRSRRGARWARDVLRHHRRAACRARAASCRRRAGFLAKLRVDRRRHGALAPRATRCRPASAGSGVSSAIDGTGVRPDAIALAKGLGGGFPIGAMLTTEALAGALPAGHPRLDVRRQPARFGRGAGGARHPRRGEARRGRARRRARRSARCSSGLVARAAGRRATARGARGCSGVSCCGRASRSRRPDAHPGRGRAADRRGRARASILPAAGRDDGRARRGSASAACGADEASAGGGRLNVLSAQPAHAA